MKESARVSASQGLVKRVTGYREFGGIVGLVILVIVFSFLSKEFLSLATFGAVLTVTAELGVVAVGIAFLIISGEFDLSVGSIFAVASMTFALLLNAAWNPILAFLIVLVIATAIGFINGILTLRTGVPSFITTLGTMMFWRGVLLAVTGGFTISFKGKSLFVDLLSAQFCGDFTTAAVWLILITVVFEIILSGTRYGNWVYATG